MGNNEIVLRPVWLFDGTVELQDQHGRPVANLTHMTCYSEVCAPVNAPVHGLRRIENEAWPAHRSRRIECEFSLDQGPRQEDANGT